MALFTSYAPPGVYTTEIFVPNTASAVGTARIPVIIGEGQQFFTISNLELFRGSSPVQDDQSVNENISDQVTGFTQNFQTTFYPVTDGTGKGITTNNPANVQVEALYSNGNIVPVTVVSLNGTTGAFVTQDIIPQGTDLTISYFFKRGDTQVINENDTFQVPKYAALYVSSSGALTQSSSGALLAIGLTTPGATGNLVSVQFVDPGAGLGVPDAQAILGAGTDAITVITRTAGSPGTIRTVANLATLINSISIPTLDGGYLTSVSSSSTQALTAGGSVTFAGGTGPSSNTTFSVQNIPIVDGTNGGVPLTVPSPAFSVLVNGVAATVSAVNGPQGQFTLASPVAYGQTLEVTYYFNMWMNTFDLLPSSNVASITEVGLGPNRADYTQGIDYSLGVAYDTHGNVVANTVNWGNNVSEAIGVSAAQDTAAFSPAEVLTTLVDENVWLRPLAGATNGRNVVFSTPDTPTTGTGQGVPTDNPALIQVYVGTNPFEAFQNLPVTVAALNGVAQQVTLFNPPAGGTSVFASYYRNTLEDQQYTVTVVTPGFSGLGTYTIQDNLEALHAAGHVQRPSSVVTQAGAVRCNWNCLSVRILRRG